MHTVNKIFKKLTLYIVRVSYNGTVQDSAPCIDCTKTMNQLGVKRIVYSTNGGALTSCKMSEYIPKSITLGRRYIESDFTLGKKSIDEEKRKKVKEEEKDS